MDMFSKLTPLGASLILTPVAMLVGFSGAIEGEYFYTNIVFPYSMLFLALLRSVMNPLPESAGPVLFFVWFMLGIIQFPIYGIIVSQIERRDLAIVILGAIHLFFVVLAFIATYLAGVYPYVANV